MSSRYNYEDVKKIFETQKYTLVSTEYKYNTKLKYICNNKHEAEILLSNFVSGQRCKKCTNILTANKNKLSFEDIKNTYSKYNCILISNESEYKNIRSIIKFKCENEHINECSYGAFKCRETKCSYCEKPKKEMIRYTYESVKNIFENKGYTLLSTEYINCYQELEFKCNNNHISKVTLVNLNQGSGCGVCNGTRQKITYEFIKSEFEKLNFTLLSTEYKGYDEILEYICPNKHNAKASYHSWKNSTYKCKMCGSNKCGEKNRLSFDYVKSKFENRGFVLISNSYKDKKEKLEFTCPNGHIGQMSFDSFYYAKNDCIECTGNKKHTIETVKVIFEADGYEVLSTEYISNKEHLNYKCPNGHVNKTRLDMFIGGKRCPDCNTNHGTKACKDYLDSINLTYIPEYKYPDCKNICPLPFDLFVNNQFVIEFDGGQHFTPIKFFGGKKHFDKQKKHDRIKTTYCITNKIPLLRISYKEIKYIPKIIESFIAILKTHNKTTPLVYFSNKSLYRDQMMIYINQCKPMDEHNMFIKQANEQYDIINKKYIDLLSLIK